MKHPFLQGKKVYLRPTSIDDAEFICEGENNPEVRYSLFLAFPAEIHRKREQIQEYMNSKETILLTIIDKDADRVVGQTAFFRTDWVSRATIFYLAILNPEYWSKGFGTEATHLMVDYAFSSLNLNRIQLHVLSDNTSAIRIYKQAGFIKEGILRQAMFHNDKYCDFWVMGILKENWLKRSEEKS